MNDSLYKMISNVKDNIIVSAIYDPACENQTEDLKIWSYSVNIKKI